MNLPFKIMSAVLLTMALMFSGEAAFAKKASKKKAKTHSSMTMKRKKVAKAHAGKRGRHSASYGRASSYMSKRKPASSKKHGKNKAKHAKKSKGKKKTHKYYSP